MACEAVGGVWKRDEHQTWPDDAKARRKSESLKQCKQTASGRWADQMQARLASSYANKGAELT